MKQSFYTTPADRNKSYILEYNIWAESTHSLTNNQPASSIENVTSQWQISMREYIWPKWCTLGYLICLCLLVTTQPSKANWHFILSFVKNWFWSFNSPKFCFNIWLLFLPCQFNRVQTFDMRRLSCSWFSRPEISRQC